MHTSGLTAIDWMMVNVFTFFGVPLPWREMTDAIIVFFHMQTCNNETAFGPGIQANYVSAIYKKIWDMQHQQLQLFCNQRSTARNHDYRTTTQPGTSVLLPPTSQNLCNRKIIHWENIQGKKKQNNNKKRWKRQSHTNVLSAIVKLCSHWFTPEMWHTAFTSHIHPILKSYLRN